MNRLGTTAYCAITSLVLLPAVVSCGPGAVAGAIRPNDPTASDALQEGDCHDVQNQGEPLVVDWKPDQRGDLEIAMREGVAVVAYSCDGIRLLKECHIDGSYGFMGMTRKEQVVRLQNADEARANLPLSGAKLGGEMQRGATLDIALIMIGKSKTTWTTPTKDDLKGSCDGATHFIRGATLGAFVLETGTSAKVRAVAEIFGASAEAGSSSDRQTKNREGDLDDCKKASPKSDSPPDQCGAPLRLVLSAIAATAPEPAADDKAPPETSTREGGCPKGLVLAEGKCTTKASAPAYQCQRDNVAECTEQCDKGHAGSCGELGSMLSTGRGIARDEARAATVLKKGCDGGDSPSCVNLGRITQDAGAAAKLFEKGCTDGDASGCGLLGLAYLNGNGVASDVARAAKLLTDACDGGYDKSCGAAASLYLEGKGVSKDAKRAADFFKRACDGSDGSSCNELGQMYESGNTIGKNPIIASMLYMRGCIRGHWGSCVNQARNELAKPAGANENMARMNFEKGCNFGRDPLGCAVLKVVFGQNRPFVPDPARTQVWRKACDSGSARDCATTGIIAVAQGNKPGGSMDLNRACTMGDGFACVVAKKIK